MPEENYVKFHKWIMPVMEQMLLEQSSQVCGIWSFLKTSVNKIQGTALRRYRAESQIPTETDVSLF